MNIENIETQLIESELYIIYITYIAVKVMKWMRKMKIQTMHSDCKFSMDLIKGTMKKKSS